MGAKILMLLSCGKREIKFLALSEEMDNRPSPHLEYEEIFAGAERERRSSTAT